VSIWSARSRERHIAQHIAEQAERREAERERTLRVLGTPLRRPVPAIMAPSTAAPVSPMPKTPDRKDQRIRDSARGEQCQVRIPGACRGGTEHTIWSHAPLGAGGKGMGIKALDLCGTYCCTGCDAVVDGQARPPADVTREDALMAWFMGHMRSLVILRQKGLA
jgi:hypothetical protein